MNSIIITIIISVCVWEVVCMCVGGSTCTMPSCGGFGQVCGS